MAVSSQAITFDDFHLVPEEFDGLLRTNGTRALIRMATLCGCWNADTGNRDPACRLCYPLGRIYDAPIEAWVHGPSRRPMKQVTAEGVVDTGEVFFTLPSTLQVPDGTRIVLPDAIERVSDILTKGSEDTIRFAHVVAVEQGLRVVRNPPEGHPYLNELVPLEDGGDFTITDTRQVVWPSDSPVPDGARYVLRLQVRSEYVVWGEPRTRVENGTQLPSVYSTKRLDFLLHPKGEGALSF
jgi:hypothetical protein